MARGRMLSKSLSTSEKRAALHGVAGRLAEFAQQLYPLLLAHADDFGRQQGDIFTVKHAIDPSSPRSDADFAVALKCLHNVGLIIWYEVDGRKFVQVNNFDQHQVGLHKRTSSKFPEPPGTPGKFRDIPGSAVAPPDWRIPERRRRVKAVGTDVSGDESLTTFRELPGVSGNFREFPSELKGTEGNRTEGNKESAAADEPPRRTRPETADDPRDHIEVITQVVLKEVLPTLGPTADVIDLKDATKERCARLKIAYDSATVAAAVDSALVRWQHHRLKADKV
jgi:hypothetical protein